MNAVKFRSVLASILAVTVLLSLFPVRTLAEDASLPAAESTQTSMSKESIPEESVPEESEPDESVPDESEPEESEPEESEPDESTPGESVPDESEPEESEPEESVPGESVPDESEPEESEPDGSAPGESIPDESVPGESVPEEFVPEESTPEEPIPDESVPAETSPAQPADLPEEFSASGPGLYFGLLHAHSGLSDGAGTPEEVFSHAARVEGLDFFALTDHSHSFDAQASGEIGMDAASVSRDWAAGKAAAAAISTDSFLCIFGYEMSWPAQMQIGHISTFGTPGFQSWKQDAYSNYDGALENYYQTLVSVPGSVSQFNHPSARYGIFSDFDYSETADASMFLLEIGSGGENAYDRYIQALDLGWHLAPSNNQASHDSSWTDGSSVRTVVYARSLTEKDLFDALRNYRAYATEDADLEILYSMDGYFMGSRLDLRHIGETADISVTLSDPTDSAIGRVEVITAGGQSIDRQILEESAGTLSFSLPAESGYYLLKITQPDGDTAVTAPIWIDAEEDLGIAALTCETAVPVQNEAFVLNLELHNRESADFLVESLEFFADGLSIASVDLDQITADSAISLPVTLRCDCVGLTRITAVLTGTLEGSFRTYEKSVDLNFRQSQQVTAILVDGSHGNAGLDQLTILRQMAMDESISMTISTAEMSAEMLEGCRFLLVSAPSEPFSDAFVNAVAAYAGYGGSLVLCGQADTQDETLQSAAELNRLLRAVGSTMEMQDDTARDAVNNGGQSTQLYPSQFNMSLSWCSGLSGNQVYRVSPGCTVNPGSGDWLVRADSTTGSADGDGDGLAGSNADITLLACEGLSGGGTVFAAGSLLFADGNMEEPENIWDEPYANRTFTQALLGIGGEAVPLSTIQEARKGAANELFRVRGYVTAGTSNAHNTFPDTLYLQDSTGGIAVTPFSGASVQQGTPVEITGFAGTVKGNRILKVGSWEVLDMDWYQYEPLEDSWNTLLNSELHGGTLVQVEGECLEIYCREDDTMAGCLLEDESGNQAKVHIEDYIGNGSDGENDLHKSIRRGRTVRAMGLLHIDEYGDTVIRVRNCEEVVYVPPRTLFSLNPLTADTLLPGAITAMAASLLALVLLRKRKKT